MVSECERARSRAEGRFACSYYAAAAAEAGKSEMEVEVVEARFWLVLARVALARGLAFDGAEDTGEPCKPRVEKTPRYSACTRQTTEVIDQRPNNILENAKCPRTCHASALRRQRCARTHAFPSLVKRHGSRSAALKACLSPVASVARGVGWPPCNLQKSVPLYQRDSKRNSGSGHAKWTTTITGRIRPAWHDD